MMTTRIIIAGSRRATYAQVRAAAASCPWFLAMARRRDDVEVISGKAPGADTHGEAIAERVGWPVKPFPAQWRRNGRYNPAEGPIRNTAMAEYAARSGSFGALVACWDGHIKGTAHMISEAFRVGLLVHVFDTRLMEPVDMREQAAYVARYGVPVPGMPVK